MRHRRSPWPTWSRDRIEGDPKTAEFRYYLDGVLSGAHVADDAAALMVESNLRPSIEEYSDSNAASKCYVDDVQITAAE